MSADPELEYLLTLFWFGLRAQASQNSVSISVDRIHPHCIDFCAGVQGARCHLDQRTNKQLQYHNFR